MVVTVGDCERAFLLLFMAASTRVNGRAAREKPHRGHCIVDPIAMSFSLINPREAVGVTWQKGNARKKWIHVHCYSALVSPLRSFAARSPSALLLIRAPRAP